MRPPRTRSVATDPLLKLGACLMGVALLFAAAVAVYALANDSTEQAAVKSATEPGVEPLVRSDPGVDPWKEPTVAVAEPEAEEPEPKPKPEPQPEAVPDTEPRLEPEVAPKPETVAEVETQEARPAPPPEPPPALPQEPAPKPPEPEPLPVERADWPSPTEEQIEEANRPRQYELPRGAIMGLTAESIGLRDAPVLRSDAPDALDQGIVHASGTSMPWSGTPERNVYLAGHRLGWPGTGSHLIFYRLDELSEGDEVELRDREGKRYGYRVIDTFAVGPEDSWVTGRVRGRDLLTLQTCVGPNWERRLIVRADRV